jgi:hypothetical protein
MSLLGSVLVFLPAVIYLLAGARPDCVCFFFLAPLIQSQSPRAPAHHPSARRRTPLNTLPHTTI